MENDEVGAIFETVSFRGLCLELLGIGFRKARLGFSNGTIRVCCLEPTLDKKEDCLKTKTFFLLVFTLGFGLWAPLGHSKVNPVDTNKVEQQMNRKDLGFYQRMKKRAQKKEKSLTKKSDHLDNRLTRKANRQNKDLIKMNHLKERLKVVEGIYPGVADKLSARIQNIEGRIAQRTDRIATLSGKKEDNTAKLTAVRGNISTLDTAIQHTQDLLNGSGNGTQSIEGAQ